MGAVSSVAAAPVISQVLMDANTITTIISNVNSMYNNVIVVTLGFLGFVGVLLPLFLSFHQKRQLKIDHKVLSDLISSEINAAKTSLMNDIAENIKKEKEQVEKGLLKTEKKFNWQ